MVAMVAAALHGGGRWRPRVRAVLGTRKGANGVARVRGVKASQNRVMWRQCSAAGMLPRWSNGGGAPACMFWPQGWATAYWI
jgi:hypothetical protein